MTKTQKRLWIGLLVMTLLTPIGVILPEKLKGGAAWGEWGPEELEKLLGYVPEKLKKWADLWKAPLPDYSLGGEEASWTVQLLSYILSGFIGILIIALVVYLISKALIKNGK